MLTAIARPMGKHLEADVHPAISIKFAESVKAASARNRSLAIDLRVASCLSKWCVWNVVSIETDFGRLGMAFATTNWHSIRSSHHRRKRVEIYCQVIGETHGENGSGERWMRFAANRQHTASSNEQIADVVNGQISIHHPSFGR